MLKLTPKTALALAAGLVVLVGVFQVATIRTGHVWGDDFSAYISHARNLVTGVEYGNTGYVRSPNSEVPKMYPPGFPLLLAPVYQAYGLSLTPMKAEGIGFFCVALFLFYLLVRKVGDEWPALAAVAVIGVSPYFWDFKDTIGSDLPFLMFTYAALLVAQQANRWRNSPRRQVVLGFAAGLLTCVAYETRSVGIVLVPVFLLCEWLAVRKLTWFGAMMGAAFVAGVVAQKLFLPVESDYAGPLLRSLSLKASLGSPLYYAKCLSVLWDNGHSIAAQMAVFALISVLVVWGGWTRFRKQWSVLDVFAVCYGLFVLLFPFGGRRYLIPIMPVYVFYAFLGARELASRWSAGVQSVLPVALLAGMALCFAVKYGTVNWEEVPNGIQRKEVTELVESVKREVGRDGTVVFPKARFLALFGGCKATECGTTESEVAALDYFRKVGVSHVVVSRDFRDDGERFLTGLVQNKPEMFEKAFENGLFSLYRLRRLP